ncbi:MAG: hypothetical protein J6M31_01830 [Bacteroidales bacterium]|nr:hypothetical protein [Bacteroidales bacterium]MBP3202328.1 hypothetical protein [Bacteroidales bacterium]
MFFLFDVDKWIIHQLPPILRRSGIYAFLRTMLYPLKQLQTAFLNYRSQVNRQLTYNAFQDYLERFLNGLFFFEGRVIYITDMVTEVAYLAYASESAEDVYMSFVNEDPSYSLNLSSVDPSQITGQFVVHVPAALTEADVATVTNWVNYYKMAGTQFTIEVYE